MIHLRSSLLSLVVLSSAHQLFAAPCENDPKCVLPPIKEVIEPPAPPDPQNYWKVAVIECNEARHPIVCAGPEEAEQIKAVNRADLADRICEAQRHGAKIIVTPEFGVVGYPEEKDEWESRAEIESYVEPCNGPSTHYFEGLAKGLQVFIQFGFPEVATNGCYYNAAVVVDPAGKVVAHHRKNCLCGESGFLEPGNDIAIYDTPVGKIGVAICWDISGTCSNPPLPRYYAAGVKILSVSSSWIEGDAFGTFQSVARSYGHNSGCHFLGSNQCYCPGAGVICPNGTQQSHIQSSGIAYGYLPLVRSPVRQSSK